MMHGFGSVESSAASLAKVKAQTRSGRGVSSDQNRRSSSQSRTRSVSVPRRRDRGQKHASLFEDRIHVDGNGRPMGSEKSVASRSTRTSMSHSRRRRISSACSLASSSRKQADPEGQAQSNEMEEVDHAAEVEMYIALARRRASLMTDHDFKRCDDGSSRNSSRKSARRRLDQSSKKRTDGSVSCKSSSNKSRRRSRSSSMSSSTASSSKKAHKHCNCEQIPGAVGSLESERSRHALENQPVTLLLPQPACLPDTARGEGVPPDMTGNSVAGQSQTTVSSMTTTDSYDAQRMYLQQLKLKEIEARRRRRVEKKKQAELDRHFDDGSSDDATLFFEDGEDEDSYFPTLFCSSGSSKRSNNASSCGTPSTASSPPVYQREKCCIKHPHIRLSPQTDVNVWTCMQYVKDSGTGRWRTVKMVCDECLAEDENVHRDDTPHHRRFRRDLRGFRNNQTCRPNFYGVYDAGLGEAFSSSIPDTGEDSDGDVRSRSSCSQSLSSSHSPRRETINVHPRQDQTPLEREAEAQRRRFVRRLAARAYHFPGNTWCEDWIQYTSNTHIVFGIFFHHPLHPVRGSERCTILLGSVGVGLLMSNLIYLWFVHAELGADDKVMSLGPGQSLEVTKLMICLWTLGSFTHTLFDLCVWHIKACTLCRYGHGNYVSDEAVKCGRTAGVTIVLLVLAFATYLVLLRASEDYKAQEEDGSEEDRAMAATSFIQPISLGGGAKYFGFLLGYIIEFVLAVFVYNPLILTIVFAGVLGCNGRVPVLGGRPREVMREQRYAMKRQRYTMPQTLKLGDTEYEADMWGDKEQHLATNF